MPETITLDDGSTREVPTAEELQNLQAGHDANAEKRETVGEFNKAKEELGLKDGQSVADRIQELKDSENPNWKKTRETMKVLKEAAKEKGINIDDNGDIVPENQSLTAEEVQKAANSTFDQREKLALKTRTLGAYDKKEQEEIGRVFDKLDSVGGTFEENMGLAIKTVLPESPTNPLIGANNQSGGAGPRQQAPGAVSSELKTMGAKFGLTDEDFKK